MCDARYRFADTLVARPADAAPPEGCQNLWLLKLPLSFGCSAGSAHQRQHSNKHPRIGFLTAGGFEVPPAFVQKLRDLGYVEGNNIVFTGLSSVSGELGSKLLDILKEIMPHLSRVAIPGPAPESTTQDLFMKETEAPARALKVRLIRIAVRGPHDYDQVFPTAVKKKTQAS